MPKIGEYYAQIRVQGLDQMQASFAEARRGLNDLASSTSGSVKGASSGLLTMLGPLRMISGALAVVGVGAGAKGLLQLAANAESLSVSFEVLLGSAQKAQSALKEIRDFAAATPFSVSGLADATRTLLSFGMESEEAIASVKMLSNVAMGDSQKLQSIALVFGQIRAAGRLTGGDLLQLINVGFNPLEMIAKKTGKSIGELRDEMGQGAIDFEAVREAFVMATSEGGRYYGMNEKMSRTLGGLWSTFADAVVSAVRGVAEFLVEGLQLKDLLAWLSTAVESGTTAVKEWYGEWGDVVKQGLKTVIAGIRAGIEIVWTIISEVAKFVMWIIENVVSFFTGILGKGEDSFKDTIMRAWKEGEFLYHNWRDILQLAWEQLKLRFSNMWERVKTFCDNVVALFKWLGKQWWNTVTDIFTFGKTVFTNLFENLKGLWSSLLDLLQGKEVKFNWKPLTEGFKSSIEAMPEFAEAKVRQTTPEIERLLAILGEKYAEHMSDKTQQVAEEAAENLSDAVFPDTFTLPERTVSMGPPIEEARAEARKDMRIAFVALEALAQQMQEEVGRAEEEIAKNTEQTAEATQRLSSAVDGNAMRVRVEGGMPAVYQ